MAYQNGITVRRGAAHDDLKADATVIDFSNMKSNQRQVFIDNTINFLKAKGFFRREHIDGTISN